MTGKATQACQKMKRNISAKTSWLPKKQLYRSYIFLTISYGSVLWKPSKGDLELIEKVQHRATALILVTSQLDYKGRLTRLRHLPLSFYHELHFFSVLGYCEWKHTIDWTHYVQVGRNEKQCTRRIIRTFTTTILSKRKQESDFWLRAANLANLLGAHLGTCIDELEISRAKEMLMNISNFFS